MNRPMLYLCPEGRNHIPSFVKWCTLQTDYQKLLSFTGCAVINLKEKMVFAVFAFVYIIQRCVTIIYCLSQTDKRLPVCVLQRSHLPVNT